MKKKKFQLLKKVKHSIISKKFESLIEKEEEQQMLQTKFQINSKWIEFCYSPIIQSGGSYDLKYYKLKKNHC